MIITGAAGFIGSAFITKLNDEGYNDLVLVDDFSRQEREINYEGKKFSLKLHREELTSFIAANHRHVQYVFHLGARMDASAQGEALLNVLNFEYSRKLWNACVEFGLPLVYASSVATYGAGERGYRDAADKLDLLKPENAYGRSKHAFDLWASRQTLKPFQWVGLKIFSAYGPNEIHKGKLASVVYQLYRQVQERGYVELFKSYKQDFADGEQVRDHVYVKDICEVLYFFMHNRKISGIFNVGTGEGRSFLDVARSVFSACDKPEDIRFIDMPQSLSDGYQYFQQAPISNLREAGFSGEFHTLEEGVNDYLQQYLIPGKRL